MKIYNLGLDIAPGKYKYLDSYFNQLVKKFSPKKSTPYTVEFIDQEPQAAEAIVFEASRKLDLIIADMDKIESKLERTENAQEKILWEKCQKHLEQEELLSEVSFSAEEQTEVKNLPLLTLKPCLGKDGPVDTNELIAQLMEKEGSLLFYTVGKDEVKAWRLAKGLAVLEAAGKIHSDLKRGFIKAEVISSRDLDQFFNLAEAKAKGLVKVVDRDYIVQDKDIIEIKFSV